MLYLQSANSTLSRRSRIQLKPVAVEDKDDLETVLDVSGIPSNTLYALRVIFSFRTAQYVITKFT